MDWLDLLDGRPSPADRAHLADCPSCRALIDSLETTSAGEPRLNNNRSAASPVKLEEHATALAAGQMRWVAPSDADVRIPVLVLDVDTDEPVESDADMVDDTVHVVPLWTDRENATSSDLLLDAEDSSTGVPWRVAFRRQTILPAHAIGNELGELTSSGRGKVSSAEDGIIAPEFSGPDIESEFDPRLSADDWLGEVLQLSRTSSGEPTAAGNKNIFISHRFADNEPKVLPFVIKPRDTPSNHDVALAAASLKWVESSESRHASITAADVFVDAAIRWLGVTERLDRLVLHVEQVSGLHQPVVLIVYAKGQAFEVPARLEPGADIVLAEDLNISERHVDALEMRLT
jgi:hypothetical protein